MIFGEALATDLLSFPSDTTKCQILQYVEDLLLMAEICSLCWEGTKTFLGLLDQAGYKVSWKKAQICQTEVKYLRFIIKKGRLALGIEQKQVISQINQLTTKRQVRESLGAMGFCQIWISGFSQIAKPPPPPHAATTDPGNDSLTWEPEQNHAFEQLKRAVTEDPALGLPDLTKLSLSTSVRKNK